ncbi:hypothetical protein [Microbacterium album]|uniref:Polysaccharide chain length determinant N-terminal domain-containing protein n=1 Tax=Microbacterium album TaxID=2053191 RepID=A0A917MMN1_9MICO|nr:hypothetical protein [Microbacterium album]GGH49070.1 hypothetical protein GCM10010921_27010 [Microbacterium album]
MNIADTLRGLLRRWYIAAPGLLLAVAAAGAVWLHVPPTYERSATQLLLPGEASLPQPEPVAGQDDDEEVPGANPFLFLGGLTTAADVLVSAVGSPDSVSVATDLFEGSEVTVARDPRTSGPMLLVTVSAPSDRAAARLIDVMLDRTEQVLEELQTEQKVPEAARVRVSPIAVDSESVLRGRDRTLLAAAAGAATALLTLFVTAAVDGLARRPRRGGRRGQTADELVVVPAAGDDVERAIGRMLEEAEPVPQRTASLP